MFGLFFVNGEMWQKRFPTSAYGRHFQVPWRRLESPKQEAATAAPQPEGSSR